jgi:aminopeptidase-like protein
VPVEKESGKLRVCIDFRNLNRATPKDEYHMPIADTLINNASGNRIISFLDGNLDIIRFSWPKKMRLKQPLYVQASLAYLSGLS